VRLLIPRSCSVLPSLVPILAPVRRPVVALAATFAVVAFATAADGAAPVGGHPPTIPRSRALWGMWAKPRDGRTYLQEIQFVESTIGRRLGIVRFYVRFGENIPSDTMRSVASRGSIPLISIQPAGYTWSQISGGASDGYLAAQATKVAAWGRPCFLNFHHEPEDDLGTFGTPEQFAAAFVHVRRVFREQGAKNCSWVWILMGWTFNPQSRRNPDSYYPGDANVDWIAADAYNWSFVRPSVRWQSFREVFAPFRRWSLGHRSRPAMVAETGVVENPGDPAAKAAWFAGARTTLKGWKNFKAFVYFNSDRDGQWWFDSSPQARRAFSLFGADAYFRAGTLKRCRSRTPAPVADRRC
jgi:hypothetical protein